MVNIDGGWGGKGGSGYFLQTSSKNFEFHFFLHTDRLSDICTHRSSNSELKNSQHYSSVRYRESSKTRTFLNPLLSQCQCQHYRSTSNPNFSAWFESWKIKLRTEAAHFKAKLKLQASTSNTKIRKFKLQLKTWTSKINFKLTWQAL